MRVTTRLNIGGPARHVLILSRLLPQRGYSSELVVGAPGAQEGELSHPRVQVTRIPTLQRELNMRQDLASLRALIGMMRKRQPQIVHTHMAKAGALGRIAAIQAGVPKVVHTFHGHVLEGYFSAAKNSVFIQLERWLAKRTHALVAVSHAIRDELLQLGIGREGQWHVVPLGLDLEELLASRNDRNDARAAFGLAREVPVVAIVGRLVPIKDHALFFRAMAHLAAQFPEAQFLVAGDGERRSDLERQGHALLGNRVRFVGWVDDLVSLYSVADVVVLTSRNEGTPVALIEAAAAGRPVVATGVGGVTDVIQDGKTGFVVPYGDPEPVSDAVARLLASPELQKEFGQRGRVFVAERFSGSRLADDMTSLYDELLSTPT